MGSRSFNAWESVERFLDRLPDGRRQWKHKHLPAGPVTMAERQGEKVVGKAWDSKSLFINEAITHYYYYQREGGVTCANLRAGNIHMERRIQELEEELEIWEKFTADQGLVHRILRTLNLRTGP